MANKYNADDVKSVCQRGGGTLGTIKARAEAAWKLCGQMSKTPANEPMAEKLLETVDDLVSHLSDLQDLQKDLKDAIG